MICRAAKTGPAKPRAPIRIIEQYEGGGFESFDVEEKDIGEAFWWGFFFLLFCGMWLRIVYQMAVLDWPINLLVLGMA